MTVTCARCGEAIEPKSRHARRFCSTKCKSAFQSLGGRPGRYPMAVCVKCGRDYQPTRSGQRFCSLACRPGRPPISSEVLAARADRAAAARATARASTEASRQLRRLANVAARTRACEVCGALFVARLASSRFCSLKCQGAWLSHERKAKVEASLGSGSRSCARCQETFDSWIRTQRFCSRDCFDAWHRHRGANRIRRRGADRMRRARPLVLARDGYTCGICKLSIRRDVDVLHPLALTLDHIIPIAAGGSDRLDNLQPAHRQCNVDKSDRLPYWWEKSPAYAADGA